jgi:hypothetical protein
MRVGPPSLSGLPDATDGVPFLPCDCPHPYERFLKKCWPAQACCLVVTSQTIKSRHSQPYGAWRRAPLRASLAPRRRTPLPPLLRHGTTFGDELLVMQPRL